MIRIVLIAHDIRSSHNVGSLLRTAEGLGIEEVYLTGYTPYPAKLDDSRLPHLAQKVSRDIHKTALGAELSQVWKQHEDLTELLKHLQEEGYTVVALEQTPRAIPLPGYKPPKKIALLIGNEVNGLNPAILESINIHLIIPMFGKKESFNVAQAAAMALFYLKFR